MGSDTIAGSHNSQPRRLAGRGDPQAGPAATHRHSNARFEREVEWNIWWLAVIYGWLIANKTSSHIIGSAINATNI